MSSTSEVSMRKDRQEEKGHTDVLSADRHTQEIRSDTGCNLVLLSKHRVSRGCGVHDEGVDSADVGERRVELESIDNNVTATALDAERKHAAKAAEELLGLLVVWMRGQAEVGNPCDLGVLLEVLGDALGVIKVALDTKRKRLDYEIYERAPSGRKTEAGTHGPG
jgi:hypothetical protein